MQPLKITWGTGNSNQRVANDTIKHNQSDCSMISQHSDFQTNEDDMFKDFKG